MNRTISGSLCAFAILAGFAGTARAQLVDHKAMTLAAAKAMVAAAEAQAAKTGVRGSIVILDEGGNLIYYEHMEGSLPGTYDLAMRKARAAYMFKGPSKNFQDGLAAGRTGILGLPNAIPFEGGVPLVAGDQLVGAIGVSMGTPPQDGEVAMAGAAALK